MPSKRKTNEQEKQKKGGGEKAKSKSQIAVSLLNPQNFCFLRVPELHKLLHLDQEVAKCRTCKWLFLSSL